jgi:zinc transport system substrate-binding protein
MGVVSLYTVDLFANGRQVEPTAANGALRVVTTIFPPYDFVRAIAGDTVHLSMLLPPGAESHSFEPTPRDIINIQHSDLFIYIGGESDEWVNRILESVDTRTLKVLALIDYVNAVEEEIVEGMEEEEEEEEGIAYDEHIWTSPKNAKILVQTIADTMSALDSDHADLYRRNAETYNAQLDKVDSEVRAIVQQAQRKTIVFGDRFPFRYFTDEYGLSYFAAFPGCSTETECSAATVAFLIDKIKAEKIPVVFHIEFSNEKIADTLSEATGARKLLLHSGHNITKRDFESGVTFLALQEKNLIHLKEALQ